MGKQTTNTSDYHQEERLTAVLVLDSFNSYVNEIASYTGLPLCLWPFNGKPLLDYTIHALVQSGIQEIVVIAVSYSHEIRSYISINQSTRHYPQTIRFFLCSEALSLGDCLKDLERENVISHNFLLIYGNGILLTNEKLNEFFEVHKKNVKKDKNCIMTTIHHQLADNPTSHSSYTQDQHICIVRDANTHKIYYYSKAYVHTYQLPLDLLENPNANHEIIYTPLDFHLAVCEPSVLHLFRDNFDLSNVEEFVKEVLGDILSNNAIYSHIHASGYFLSVHNLSLYRKGTFDVLRRWTYPFVPEILAARQKSLIPTANTASSPQVRLSESSLPLAYHSYPIVYDKHNIYKQGDIQLDRLSDIQQDVFIGHKSQIFAGVCLRSVAIGQNCLIGKNTRIENSIIWNNVHIGENCIIKDSIICDNVVLRNNVKIKGNSVICKGVTIGNDVEINERTTLIASNSNATSSMMDEVEIDDELQLKPQNFQRSNSKPRRNSSRISEKSTSERSLNSQTEETIISDSHLVGVDGFGKALISNYSHDDHPMKSLDQFDDDDDEDDDDDDDEKEKKEMNPFDAWGYRIDQSDPKPPSDLRRDQTAPIGIEKDPEKENSNSDSTDSEESDADSSFDGDSQHSIHSSGSEGVSGNDFSTNENQMQGNSQCQKEILRTLKRGYTKKSKIEDLLDELKTLKPAFAVSSTEFEKSITHSVLILPLDILKNNENKYWKILKSTLDLTTAPIMKDYMKINNEQSQMNLLNALHETCLAYSQPIGEAILEILHYFYNEDVLDEQWLLKWYSKIEAEAKSSTDEQKPYYEKLAKFFDWLNNAETDDDDEEEDDD